MSTALFWGIRAGILNAKSPLNAGLIALPVFYGLTVCVNVLSIVHDGPKCESKKPFADLSQRPGYSFHSHSVFFFQCFIWIT